MFDDPEYLAWAMTVPADITADAIWRTPAYRLSLFAMSRAQLDSKALLANRLSRPHLDQLLRAVGAISADLDEGYSRSSGPERAHYYEYGCGSARESRGWYYKCAVAFPPELVEKRLALYSRIVRILTAIIPRERVRRIEPRRVIAKAEARRVVRKAAPQPGRKSDARRKKPRKPKRRR